MAPESIRKRHHVEKAGNRSGTVKQTILEGNWRFGASILETNTTKTRAKNAGRFRYWFLIDFFDFRQIVAPFWEPKKRPQSLMFVMFFVSKKRVKTRARDSPRNSGRPPWFPLSCNTRLTTRHNHDTTHVRVQVQVQVRSCRCSCRCEVAKSMHVRSANELR